MSDSRSHQARNCDANSCSETPKLGAAIIKKQQVSIVSNSLNNDDEEGSENTWSFSFVLEIRTQYREYIEQERDLLPHVPDFASKLRPGRQESGLLILKTAQYPRPKRVFFCYEMHYKPDLSYDIGSKSW